MITIRLKQTGTKNRKKWRVVVLDSRRPRNGRLMEEIGSYNPLKEPPEIQMRRDRYDEWVRKGAQPTEVVRNLVKRGGLSSRAD